MFARATFTLAGFLAAAALSPQSLSAGTPVLLELFTSEGCSSCPSADQLLERLDRTQPIAGADLIVLSEHVDYWDQLGWKDPYSSAAFTARQQSYASLFRLDSTYTPQLVVDGRAELVGSDAAAARQAVVKALREQKVPLGLTVRREGQAVVVRVTAPALPQVTRLYVAVADEAAESQVARGENRGRRLKHVAVVRTLTEVGEIPRQGPLDRELTIPLPAGAGQGTQRVVAFLQESRSRRVVGVGQQKLNIQVTTGIPAARPGM